MIDLTRKEIPPGQQLVAQDKWPIIGERKPADSNQPWTLKLHGLVENEQTFSLDDLSKMEQTTLRIDIHCVTRWSRMGVEFSGVLLSELLKAVAPVTNECFLSFGARSERNHSTSLPIETAIDQQTLIATHVDGEPISLDHGGPIRNIVPGRYFYKSVKWLQSIEFLQHDKLGFWEAQTGYHNNADPWLEERYMAPTIDRRTAIRLIESLDFSRQDLRSIDASKRELAGLNAKHAQLRDADFRRSNLANADFTHANLSNAHLQRTNLQHATFIGTDLEGANLSGADLRFANLTDCSLFGSSFFELLEDGSTLNATIDSSTILPPEQLEPLTKKQFDFVRQSLAA